MKRWDAIRARLKPLFERAGLTSCEFGYDGCLRNFALGFAHSKRRRNIMGDEIEEVALACANCHSDLDGHGEAHSIKAVRAVIAARLVPVEKICDKS